MDILYVVMPAYNEEENIETVVRQWMPVLKGKSVESKIVIADSGSGDRTHEILTDLQKEFKQLEILPDTEKQHGPKLMALYSYSIEHGADYIFQTDSDGQTDSEEFKDFWEMRQKYDIILGNRTIREDGKCRAFVEHIVCLLLKAYFGTIVPDANAPFRLMKSEVVAKYLHKLSMDYDLPNIMLTTYFSYYHEKMVFRKISFHERLGGKNSINILKIIRIGWKAIKDFKRLKKEM